MSGEAQGQKEKLSGSTSLEPGQSLEESEEMEVPISQTGGQGSEDPEHHSEVEAVVGAPQFQHPLLKGKSPEEVERIFQTQQEAIQSQNEELNRRFESPEQPSAPQPHREEEVDYGDDFLAPRFKALETRLTSTLETMVAPLLEGQKKQENDGVRERLRSRLKHFITLEPHIDAMLREQKQNPAKASENTLTLLYHAAVGLTREQGIDLDASAAPAPSTSREEPRREELSMNIPQHRPSGAPLPETRPQKNQRPLTEGERRLAREYFPNSKDPEVEYRKFQDMDEEDVVEPGFSKEGW